MERTPLPMHCDLCGENQLVVLFWAYDRRFETSKERFAVLRCQSCGIGQTYPRPATDQLREFYPEVYHPTKDPPKRYYKKYIERFQKDKVAKLKRLVSNGKILDVGCGVGYFLKEANEAGYEAMGIEISEVAVSTGRRRLRVNILCGDFITHPFDDRSFDVVTLWHTFEHLADPRTALEKIRTVLRPQGLLVIGVPNLSSFQARLFKSRWYHLDVPRHLFHYSPVSLVRLVEEHGFCVSRIDHYSREHNGSGILGSLMRLSPPNEAFIYKLIRKTVGITFANALAWLESTLYQGGTFSLFAVKQ